MNWRLGTIGFAYPEWNGVFYPPGCPAVHRLREYARRFDSVELDTTFYALPPENVVRNWAQNTPSHFQFTLKAPKAATHDSPRNLDSLLELGTSARILGAKLGAILLQFPPDFSMAEWDVLVESLARLRGLPVAVELRHRSWWFPRTANLLEQHGAAWVASDLAPVGHAGCAPGEPGAAGYRPLGFRDTADFLYFRWCGRHGQYERDDFEVADCTARLQWWLQEAQAAFKNLRTAFAFFGNSFAGHGPASAQRLASILGVSLPDRVQSSLFD